MRRVGRMMKWSDTKASLVVKKSRVCMDLGKAVKQGVVLENGSNGKGVGVADNPQIAAKSVGGFDG